MDKVKKRFVTSSTLPLMIEPSDKRITLAETLQLLSKENDFFKQNLLKYGGLLLRNFPINDAHAFGEVIKHLKTGHCLDYIGGDSPRKKVVEGIYTSTEAPSWVKIPLHNELSFVKNYPSHIYFFCEIAPEKDGETILGDARKVFQSIDPAVRKRFTDKHLRYVSCYYFKDKLMLFLNKYRKFHKSWIDVFETEDKSEVERLCRENEFTLKWTKGDWMELSQVCPAVMSHPETKEMVWFNQAHLFDFNPKLLGFWRHIAAKVFYFRKHMRLHEVFFGDNSPIPREDLYHIMDTLDQNTVKFPWQKGDVLVLDNVLAMHGRATFEGKRRVLAAMTGE